MEYFGIKKSITFAIASLLLLQMAQAQRPSFAGLRPPGLNQKDKYNMNNNNLNNNSNAGITNRFGTPEVVTLPFGATQKPPASFIPVVFPESNYLALTTATPKPVPDVIVNRFGSIDNSSSKPNAPSSGNSTSVKPQAGKGAAVAVAAAAGTTTAAAAGNGASTRIPIDAKNDSELVAIINRLPEDQRPFWFINAAAIEAQRNGSFRNFAGALDSPRTFFG